MKALTAAEMREVDRLTTERFGVPQAQLMEQAGQSVARVFLEQYSLRNEGSPSTVAVLCGKGNNGGDGFVLARHLVEEAERVTVYLFAEPVELKGDAAANFDRWKQAGGAVKQVTTESHWDAVWPEIATSEVIIDALLGTGIRGAATGLIAQAVENINALSRQATAPNPACIVAVDTPSGLPSDGGAADGPVLYAHLTVTFTAPKLGQLASEQAACCGELFVEQIGSPAALVEEVGKSAIRWAGPDEFASLPLRRAADSNKGTFGHLLIVAGSVGKSGAAIMAGLGALRGGAGLVTIGAPEPIIPILAAAHPEYTTIPLHATSSGTLTLENLRSGLISAALRGKSVLAIGPGIGTLSETQSLLQELLASCALPTVVDADGLNALATEPNAIPAHKSAHLVLTPHPGEMARLLNISIPQVQKDRVKIAQDAARFWNAFVVLKGYHTVIASPSGEIFINTTGDAGLAKGGSGDVLTGLVAALVSQFGTEELFRVLALGVYLHGEAASIVSRQSDPSGVLASEVANALPYARRRLLQELSVRA